MIADMRISLAVASGFVLAVLGCANTTPPPVKTVSSPRKSDTQVVATNPNPLPQRVETAKTESQPLVVAQDPEPPPMSGVGPLPRAKNLKPQVVFKWNPPDLIPFQQWPQLPGKLIGLIWAAGPQPWGAGYDHTAMPSPTPDRIEYKFGVNGSSPYAVYFTSDGRGKNFIRNWSVPLPGGSAPAQYNAAMFEWTTPNSFGLSRRAHIVEVDVNDKRGGVGLHFVITNARVIDGTRDFPLSAHEVLVRLRLQFDEYLLTTQQAMVKAVDSRTRTFHSSYHFEPAKWSVIGVFPTWNANLNAIDVVFKRAVWRTGTGTPKQGPGACPPCPPGAPCAMCRPDAFMTTPTATARVDVAVRYVVDASGEIVAETHYLPTASDTESTVQGRYID